MRGMTEVRTEIKKNTREHMSWPCTFQAVLNSVQPALKEKSHNSQSFFSIFFLFISMLTLIGLSQPYRRQCLLYPCKEKVDNPQVTNIKDRRK